MAREILQVDPTVLLLGLRRNHLQARRMPKVVRRIPLDLHHPYPNRYHHGLPLVDPSTSFLDPCARVLVAVPRNYHCFNKLTPHRRCIKMSTILSKEETVTAAIMRFMDIRLVSTRNQRPPQGWTTTVYRKIWLRDLTLSTTVPK